MSRLNTIAPCLWFDTEAEPAARFYTSVFPDSRILRILPYPDYGQDIHGKPAGSVMVVDFELSGQRCSALNGGPHFKLTPAVSLQVFCESQEEIDRYWDLLGAGGAPEARQCGWLADRFGLSWQIVPVEMGNLIQHGGAAVMAAVMKMQKLDLAALRRAAAR